MVELRPCAKIVILTLMVSASIVMLYIISLSSLSGWSIKLSTNLFGEGPFEIVLFLIAAVGGIIVLVYYIKEVCLKNRKPPSASLKMEEELKGKKGRPFKKTTL